MTKRNPFHFLYHFQFANGPTKDYRVSLNPDTLSLIPVASAAVMPEWVRLAHRQCRQCPLTPDSHPNCPIAVNLMELVESFKTIISYDDCMVICETAERQYSKKTSVMEGLAAIFGIIMATSDCPIMNFLKPMARFHLPFATIEETTVRTASMYLLANYLKYKNQKEMTFDFKTLEKHYQKVQVVNEGLLARITNVSGKDADKNAIITLHSLSQFLSAEISYSLNELEYIFAGRFED
jgi:hypothetical protein